MSEVVNYTGERRMHFGSIISTYRCNAKCNMCNIWRFPTRPADEVGVEVYEKLPQMDALNLTGGEALLRNDLDEIVTVLKTKARRIVISSNGWFVNRTVRLFKKHGNSIGIRISIEGLSHANDGIRGMPKGFDNAIRILTTLHSMGITDIGFGLTIQDANANDVKELYQLAKMMDVEFATAALHNSFYFHKQDNRLDSKQDAIAALKELAADLLHSKRPKDWFRAYFNYGLINYLQGRERLLPCRMAHDAFFLEPNGDVLPCNGMDHPMPLGNLRHQSWDEIWYSEAAEKVREAVRNCPKQCWMMGSVGQEIKKHPIKPLKWVMEHKLMKREIEIPVPTERHPHSLFGADNLEAKQTMQLVNIRASRQAARETISQ
ncbi:MAG: radical SAM protein [Terracidiphilus sp.]